MRKSDLVGCAMMLAMAWAGCYVAHESGTWIGIGVYVILLVLYTTTRAMQKMSADHDRALSERGQEHK